VNCEAGPLCELEAGGVIGTGTLMSEPERERRLRELREEARAWKERDDRQEAELRARMRRVAVVMWALVASIMWAFAIATAYGLLFHAAEVDAMKPAERGETAGGTATNFFLEWFGGRALALGMVLAFGAVAVAFTHRAWRAWRA